jgi:hypothetical protein
MTARRCFVGEQILRADGPLHRYFWPNKPPQSPCGSLADVFHIAAWFGTGEGFFLAAFNLADQRGEQPAAGYFLEWLMCCSRKAATVCHQKLSGAESMKTCPSFPGRHDTN